MSGVTWKETHVVNVDWDGDTKALFTRTPSIFTPGSFHATSASSQHLQWCLESTVISLLRVPNTRVPCAVVPEVQSASLSPLLTFPGDSEDNGCCLPNSVLSVC